MIDETFNELKINRNGAHDVIEYSESNAIKIELRLDEKFPIGLHRFDCTAANVYGNDTRSTFVERFAKPFFLTQTHEIVEIRSGASTILDCSVSGYPAPQIIWLKVCKFRFIKKIGRLTLHAN